MANNENIELPLLFSFVRRANKWKQRRIRPTGGP